MCCVRRTLKAQPKHMDCTGRLWYARRTIKKGPYCSTEFALKKEMLYGFFKVREATGSIESRLEGGG
jgi:hypothetical protein